MKRIAATIAALALSFALVLIPTGAHATGAHATDDPVDCSEVEDYYLAVVSNFQEENDALRVTIAEQRVALDRVTASAEARNREYAAVVEKNRQLRDKIRRLRDMLKQARAA